MVKTGVAQVTAVPAACETWSVNESPCVCSVTSPPPARPRNSPGPRPSNSWSSRSKAVPQALRQVSGHVFRSDVATNGLVVEDEGRVLLALALKDPGTADLPSRPTSANFVTVTRYRVRYVRADGRSTPGVDVPYAFDGGMTFTVGPDGGVSRFVLVRAQAKREAPLATLRNGGGAIALSTLAEVTFVGRDQAGHDVTVTGLIGVNFADWPDGD